MLTAKEQAIKIINQQPDDSNFDDFLHELAFAKMVERGLTDVETGNFIDNQKVNDIISQWQK